MVVVCTLLFCYVYICIDVGDPVEGRVGMPLTGSLLFVYICIDVGDPIEGSVGMPLTGSLMFVYICIDVGDPVEGRVGMPLTDVEKFGLRERKLSAVFSILLIFGGLFKAWWTVNSQK